jgi:dUTPase
MKMIPINIECEEGVFPPAYKNQGSAGVEVLAKSFKKLFKGNKIVPLDRKLQQSLNEGYLTLRGFERVLVGTGINMSIPFGYALQIFPTMSNALKRGLLVVPTMISQDYEGELDIVLVNNSPFLSKVTLGDRIAEAVLVKIEVINFVIKEPVPFKKGDITKID